MSLLPCLPDSHLDRLHIQRKHNHLQDLLQPHIPSVEPSPSSPKPLCIPLSPVIYMCSCSYTHTPCCVITGIFLIWLSHSTVSALSTQPLLWNSVQSLDKDRYGRCTRCLREHRRRNFSAERWESGRCQERLARGNMSWILKDEQEFTMWVVKGLWFRMSREVWAAESGNARVIPRDCILQSTVIVQRQGSCQHEEPRTQRIIPNCRQPMDCKQPMAQSDCILCFQASKLISF